MDMLIPEIETNVSSVNFESFEFTAYNTYTKVDMDNKSSRMYGELDRLQQKLLNDQEYLS